MCHISEYGLKIKNIEASTLYEYNNGVRDHYEYKEAMFTNSLFKDYLERNGLDVWNNESTRDIICLEFNYGSRSYKKECEHLRKVAENTVNEYKKAKVQNDTFLLSQIEKKRKKVLELTEIAHENRKKYKEKSKDELREMFYVEGIDVPYVSYKRDGSIRNREVIHYKMLYRSTGKAKKGSCMFICDRLYETAIKYLRMGIELDDSNPMIVEISAYSPLISSGIVGKLRINPRNILILKDVDRFFETNVISIETDENKHCFAKAISEYRLKNTLFDGQALIDSSIFPEWAHGYILLRQHFCKMAAFSSNMQEFFKDYYGDRYKTATVTDMFGVVHYVKDIELVTTDNSMKWIKFHKSYDYWCEWVEENGSYFGIVKTSHKSKLGSYQKMSYQMVNSLDNDIMENVCMDSIAYVERLKKDLSFFIEYLKLNSNFSNDYDALVALLEHNPEFERCDYFRRRRKMIIQGYVTNLKSGRIIQNAENLTIVGSPYAMLLYAATGDPDVVDTDDTLQIESGTIQCYTERFNDGEYLAFFRSPFNSKNNLTYLHNSLDKRIKKYFNLGQQIVAVNMIGTDFQDRNNGSDQDSDFGYTTNQPDIVNHAKRCYMNYHTIVNNIPKSTKRYKNNLESFAEIDNALAKSQLDIGESSNLAQIAQSYDYTYNSQGYSDYVCILSVIAQAAIDSAKRQFDIDITSEIKRIKRNMNVSQNKYPLFWRSVKFNFPDRNINPSLDCPMNRLCNLNIPKFRSDTTTLPMSVFFIKHQLDIDRRISRQIEELITKYSLKVNDCNINHNDSDYLLLKSDFESLISSIRKIGIANKYTGLMSRLLDRAFNITPNVSRNKQLKSKLNSNMSLLFKVLYEVNSDAFLKCFTAKP